MSKQYKNKASAFIVIAILVLVISFPAIASTAKATTISNDLTAQPLYQIRSAQAGAPSIGYSSQQNGTTSLAYSQKQNGDPPGFSPSQIISAYDLYTPTTTYGAGTTVAIIDAYYDPNIASNLAYFDSQQGVTGTGSLTIYNMAGSTTNAGWAVETSLDVEWVHAIAPDANILLVEAKSNSLGDLTNAISYATSQPGVVAVSMSWGANEFSGETSYDTQYLVSHNGLNIVFFASSGDSGAGVIWPSASPNVISVGGTTLTLATSTTPTSESAWSDSGGGVSAYEPEPTWQINYGLIFNGRSTPDVSFDANPNTGISIYDTFGESGWLEVGGTSVGAQCWAGVQALGQTAGHSNFYADGSSPSSNYFRDSPTGSNGYPANSGYDLDTGLGSPVTTNFTPQDFSISAAAVPTTIYVQSSGSTIIPTTPVTVTAFSSFSGTVDITAAPPSEDPSFTATLASPSVTLSPGASLTDGLTVTVPPNTPHGTYLITVTGTVGTLSQSTAFAVKVQDFSISASPTSLNIKSGSSGTSTITVTPISGFSGKVSLTSTVTGSGLTASLSPTSVSPTTTSVPGGVTVVTPATSTLTVTAASTATGTYTITVTGTGPGPGGIPIETAKVTVTVSSTTHRGF